MNSNENCRSRPEERVCWEVVGLSALLELGVLSSGWFCDRTSLDSKVMTAITDPSITVQITCLLKREKNI